MRSAFHMNPALAASLAALMIGAPAGYMIYSRHPASPMTNTLTADGGADVLIGRAAPQNAPSDFVKKVETDTLLPGPAPVAPPAQSYMPAPMPRRELQAAGKARTVGAVVQRPVAEVVSRERLAHPVLDEDQALARKEHRDKFEAHVTNPVRQTAQEPVSTFSADVDTASYSFARRMLNAGQLPPKDAVRAEEFINYFPYDYPKPDSADAPFRPTITVTAAPWNPDNRLVHIAVQGYALQAAQRPRANLVFLVDVSGSMMPDDRLPLVKNALRMLVGELKPDDTVGIVTYASGSGVALEPTKIADKGAILAAIDSLGAGGSTAGAQGILDAYRLAEAHFDKQAVNRIILSTDGDFNVGVTDQRELLGMIERKRESGVYLSILGVGQDNYNDALMQKLAQNGNGVAAYVDTLNEARKVLVEEASSTLFPIAKDVKIQVEWNPAQVAEYRLIGYETRDLRREDFNNDKVDAGDMGSGHRVTAIYEITPAGGRKLVDDLRYGKKGETPAGGDELGFFKLRYKLPHEQKSRLISQPIRAGSDVDPAHASTETRFSIAAAAFAQLLKGAPYLGSYGYDDVIALAQGAKGDDPFGYRAEFVNLARLAKSARP